MYYWFSNKNTKRKNPPNSPLTLQKRYIARANRPRPPAAHTQAAAAAKAHQAQPPQNNKQPTAKANDASASNRNVSLTRFKPGHDWETECQVAHAFKRPPRLFKEDKPFYPWLPRFEPLVNFHLNFKF